MTSRAFNPNAAAAFLRAAAAFLHRRENY